MKPEVDIRSFDIAQGGSQKVVALLVGTESVGAVSEWIPCLEFLNKTFQIGGTFSGTVVLEATQDDALTPQVTPTIKSLGSLTAPGKLAVNEVWRFVRARISTLSSGHPTAKLGMKV